MPQPSSRKPRSFRHLVNPAPDPTAARLLRGGGEIDRHLRAGRGQALGLQIGRTGAEEVPGAHWTPLKYATEEAFELTPLPCWAHLSPEAYRERVAALVEEIEREAAAALARSGRQPLGVAGILRQNPQTRPNWTWARFRLGSRS